MCLFSIMHEEKGDNLKKKKLQMTKHGWNFENGREPDGNTSTQTWLYKEENTILA